MMTAQTKIKEDFHSVENQEILRRFVDREIICLVSMLVYELAKKWEYFPDYEDDLLSAFEGVPDYEEAAIDAGWIWKDEAFINPEESLYSNAENWQELCEDEGIDTEDYRGEIFEHWVVSDFLADRLEDKGERILRDFFGLTVWGRGCTGQAILLDGVIGEIASEMEILRG